MRKWWIGLVLVVLGLCFPAGAVQAKGMIRIGLLAPLTGQLSSEGRQAKQVVELLVSNINAAGGVLGQPLELVTEDDADDPHTAVAAAKRLVERKVTAVIGAYASSITEAVQPVFDAASIIQVSYGSTAVPLTQQGYKYFFRVCSRDDQQAPVIVDAVKNAGAKKVVVVHDQSLYSRRLAAKATKLLKAEAGRQVAKIAVDSATKDFSKILKTLRMAKADAILCTGYYPEVGELLKQRREMGWTVPVFGADATNNPELVKIAGVDSAKGFCFSSMPLLANLPSPDAKRFLAAYETRYQKPLESIFALLAVDALDVVVVAIEETGSTDTKTVAAYLHDDLSSYFGMSGKIAFDAHGDREAPLYVIYCLDQAGKPQLQL